MHASLAAGKEEFNDDFIFFNVVSLKYCKSSLSSSIPQDPEWALQNMSFVDAFLLLALQMGQTAHFEGVLAVGCLLLLLFWFVLLEDFVFLDNLENDLESAMLNDIAEIYTRTFKIRINTITSSQSIYNGS